MKFKNLSDWIMIGHCATRIVKGGSVTNVKDRVAFIEKTPRVRIDNNLRDHDYLVHHMSIECEADGLHGATCPESFIGKRSIWINGYKDSDYGESRESRQWCDQMLKALGWEIEEE